MHAGKASALDCQIPLSNGCQRALGGLDQYGDALSDNRHLNIALSGSIGHGYMGRGRSIRDLHMPKLLCCRFRPDFVQTQQSANLLLYSCR
jgi:hypothetical protein